MTSPNQPIGDFQNEEKFHLNNVSNDDREDSEHENEEREEESGDWGDVDPAGGEEPTAPGSAV